MDNTGKFLLNLVNAEGAPASELDCRVEFLRPDNTCVLRAQNLQFPPSHTFTLPAFPQLQNLRCFIVPSRYQMVQSRFFTLQDGSTTPESALLLRDPEKWAPEFKLWSALPNQFTHLKAILEGKYLKLKHGPDIGLLTASIYDGLQSPILVLAKMALLNLFMVLSTETDPVSSQPWFTFVKQILVIDRERFVAVVSSDLFESVDHILNNLSKFKKLGFFPGDVSLHVDNYPSEFQIAGQMISVKCAYEQGNVQFTLGKFKDRTGSDCILLDCDMDEHSNVIEHLSDVFQHVFTGGTHPVEIHEYIVHHKPGIELGYSLHPITAPLVAAATVS